MDVNNLKIVVSDRLCYDNTVDVSGSIVGQVTAYFYFSFGFPQSLLANPRAVLLNSHEFSIQGHLLIRFYAA
jgi:hypothetical protein